jgi:hypothetical protein
MVWHYRKSRLMLDISNKSKIGAAKIGRLKTQELSSRSSVLNGFGTVKRWR